MQFNNKQQKSSYEKRSNFESVKIIGHQADFLIKFYFFLPFIQKIQSHFWANLF